MTKKIILIFWLKLLIILFIIMLCFKFSYVYIASKQINPQKYRMIIKSKYFDNFFKSWKPDTQFKIEGYLSVIFRILFHFCDSEFNYVRRTFIQIKNPQILWNFK
ncbi:hypothetical protein BpHYR1_041113 [Brachionus plicatilis]|uniref:Uncharacterized protein n=1 Tax=Brachionus plicatilis TaxID=10195 RepID=A0A3M7S3M5_BRAPC|nr:hypothetical protein BpHYR1_041113 [Brachionus plicatilis]